MLPKLLLDEVLPPTVAAALRADGYDVVHLSDPRPDATPDDERVLITIERHDQKVRRARSDVHGGHMLSVEGPADEEQLLDFLQKLLAVLEVGADGSLYVHEKATN